MHGPAAIAIEPHGRLFVTDYGGRRVLTWLNVDKLQTCQAADAVIGEGQLSGPEAVAFDARTGAIFIADTLDHTVKGYRPANGKRIGPVGGSWTQFVTHSSPWAPPEFPAVPRTSSIFLEVWPSAQMAACLWPTTSTSGS